MKFAAVRPYADLEALARKMIEIANSVEAVQDGLEGSSLPFPTIRFNNLVRRT
jgi:hypothetical protein